MSKLQVSTIETPDENLELVLRTGNTQGPSLVISAANDNIFLNGTLYGLDFPEVRDAANVAYEAADTANASSSIATSAYNQANVSLAQANTARDHANVSFGQANTARDHANVSFGQANTARDHANISFAQANSAYDKANTGASTGKAIAMAIVFG